jgi:DNA mismatch repair ATPase MutS
VFDVDVEIPSEQPSEPSEVETELAQMDIDALTPREALQRLYELQAKVRNDS